MKALIDTNVIVDVLTRREPYFPDSSMVLDRAERGEYLASICATTVTTVFYLVNRHLGPKATIAKIKDLTAICSVSQVNHGVVESALQGKFRDFEDAVLHHSSVLAGMDCIVTRNTADFRASSLLVFTPAQFLAALDRKRA